jgi:hypothetical protein
VLGASVGDFAFTTSRRGVDLIQAEGGPARCPCR